MNRLRRGLLLVRLHTAVIAFIALILITSIVPTILVVGSASAQSNVNVSVGVGDTVLVVNGRTSPSAFVTIVDGGSTIGTTTADQFGNFSKTFPAFTPGVHHLSKYAQDVSGRLTDVVQIEVNVVEHFQTTVDVFLPTTLFIAEPSVQAGQMVPVRGSTVPNGSVALKIDNTTILVQANASGDWSYTIPTVDLSVGGHSLYAVVTESGDQSYPTNSYGFDVFAAPATAPVPATPGPPTAQPNRPNAPVITSPQNGQKITERDLKVSGTAQPGTRIELFNGSKLIGSTFADGSGNWEITITLTLPVYELQARACRQTACSGFSNKVIIYYQSNPTIGNFRAYLEKYSYTTYVRKPVQPRLHIEGGVKPYTVKITWGDGRKETFKTSQNEISLRHIFQSSGKYKGAIYVYDKNGARYVLDFTTEVFDESAPLWWIIWLILLMLLLLLLGLLYRHWRPKRKK